MSSEVDPLVKELTEKKLSFKRNVVSLATELKDVRTRLVAQQHLCAQEIKARQSAELKARSMEDDVAALQNCLLQKDEHLMSQLDEFRSQLSLTRAMAESSAQSTAAVVEELNEQRIADLKQHEERVSRLGEQVDHLQQLLEARELSQKKLLEEVSPRNVDEIVRLRDEIRILSAHWISKTKELQSQLEKQRRTDQEMKKKILKLEFCLQESRSQMRKLHRKGERRDKAVKELRDLIIIKQPNNNTGDDEKNNFWESSGFKFMISMSMLALVIITKR